MLWSLTLASAIINGDEPTARSETARLLDEGYAADTLLDEVCIPAIQQIKSDVDAGHIYLPDLFISQRAYQSALAVLQPYLSTPTYTQAIAHGEVDMSCFL